MLDVVEHQHRRLAAELEVHPLEVSAAVRAMCLPVCTDPVSDDHVHLGWLISACPVGSPRPVITFSTPFGRMSAASSANLHGRDRRRLGRFQHDRVARRESGADLPDRHHQRVVPRRDLPDHPHRFATRERGVALHVLAGRPALQAARGAGEEAQVVGHHRKLVVYDGRERLAGIQRLGAGDLLAVLFEEVGERKQGLRTFGGCCRRPAGESATRGLHRACDVLGGRVRRPRELLACGGVQHRLGLAL